MLATGFAGIRRASPDFLRILQFIHPRATASCKRHGQKNAKNIASPSLRPWHCQSYREGMILMMMTPVFAAAGWAFLYLLCGGGLGGALLIFIVLKMIGH